VVPVYSVDAAYTKFVCTEEHPKCEKYGCARPAISIYALGSAAVGEQARGIDPNAVYLTYSSHERGVEEVDSYLGWIDRLPIVEAGVRQPCHLNWKKIYGTDDPLHIQQKKAGLAEDEIKKKEECGSDACACSP